MLVSEGNSDMANFYFHGRRLEDNSPKPGDSPRQMQANIHNLCQPENLGFLGRVHEVFDTYLDRMTKAEISWKTALSGWWSTRMDVLACTRLTLFLCAGSAIVPARSISRKRAAIRR